MDANRFATKSLNDPRILRILSAALNAADPYIAVKNHLPRVTGDVYGLAIGKAAVPMLTALAESIPLSGALAISKYASSASLSLFPVLLSGHPIPDARSVHAGERALEFVSSLKEEDTLVCLISGGGSALVTLPLIPLEELQTLTASLLASGATINEINTLRRHMDRVKGGGLARAMKARIISLILSDVIGNPLEAIASGPTAPDPTTREDTRGILEKYASSQSSILQFSNSLVETTKPNHPTFSRVQNIIIGDNTLAAQAVLEQAQRDGFDSEILTNELQGEAREVGALLANKLRDETTKRPHPFCLIAGGETTVTIKGNGKGGRNQELALAAVNELRGLENVMLIALATDGDDGPTDAAGAIATGESAERAERLGLDAADYLSRNDAYPFFESLGDLIRTHPTGTNVNDLIFLFAL
jgi:hydroxypyruvate reductase